MKSGHLVCRHPATEFVVAHDYFSSFNDETMQTIMAKDSVYERLAETLRLHAPQAAPSWLLEFVANFDDFQEDWQKRLRELRYLGMVIVVSKSRNAAGKVVSSYRLDHDVELPENHKFLIKDYERQGAKARRSPAD